MTTVSSSGSITGATIDELRVNEDGTISPSTATTSTTTTSTNPTIDNASTVQWVAGTITIGTVTTGEPGSSVQVTNTGTDTAAVLNFTIPAGNDGIAAFEITKQDNGTISFNQLSDTGLSFSGDGVRLITDPLNSSRVLVTIPGLAVTSGHTGTQYSGISNLSFTDDLIVNQTSPNSLEVGLNPAFSPSISWTDGTTTFTPTSMTVGSNLSLVDNQGSAVLSNPGFRLGKWNPISNDIQYFGNTNNLVFEEGTNVTIDVGALDSNGVRKITFNSSGTGGSAGRTVQSITIDTNTGHLFVLYTDSSTPVDLGAVVGPPGPSGELTGTITSDRVLYNGSTLQSVLDTILYVATDITAFTSSVTEAEIGASLTNIALNWTINKTVNSQTLNGTSLSSTARTFNIVGPINGTTSWTLVATDGQTSDTATSSVTFKNRRYWGTSNLSTLADSDVLTLANELTTSRAKTITYDATGGKYIYYCYPTSFGSLTSVTVGGLSFSDYTVVTRSFTNQLGYSTSYNIVRFNNLQTGSAIQVVWS